MVNSILLRVDRFSDRKAGHLDPPSTHILSRNTTRGIEMKTCTKCYQQKALMEFYSDQGSHASKTGLKSHCKDCQKQQRKVYRNSEQGKTTESRYRKKYPDKIRARDAVKHAVQRGKMPGIATQKCQECSTQAVIYHHHKGYAKEYRLDVIPLCSKCDYKAHRQGD